MKQLISLITAWALLVSPLAAQLKDSNSRTLGSLTFATLGTPANGTIVYCSDCTSANPTASSGTGAMVRRENGAWNGGGGSIGSTQISQVVVGTSTANVTFSNIPSGYTDLMLVVSARSASAVASDTVVLQANGDTGANYNNVRIFATGTGPSSVSSSVSTAGPLVGVISGSGTTQPGSFTMMIPGYTSTTFQKTGNSTGGYLYNGNTPDMEQEWWTWNNTAAITSLKLTTGSGNSFGAGSTFTLYGVSTSSGSVGTSTIASGTAALGTSAIASGACATVVSATATGVATTDTIQADFNADPTAITGYIPSTSGILTIIKYPTANTVNFKVCNMTSASVTPGAVTLNWRVTR